MEIFNTKATSVLSDETRDNLVAQMQNLLTQYGHENTEKGVRTIVDEWWKNNQWIDALLRKHPNYVDGKFYVAFSKDFTRVTNPGVIKSFFETLRDNFKEMYVKSHGIEESRLEECENMTYAEVRKLANDACVHARSENTPMAERAEWVQQMNLYNTYTDKFYHLDHTFYINQLDEDGEMRSHLYVETPEMRSHYDDFWAITDKLQAESQMSNLLTDEAEQMINAAFPNAHAHRGAKISKTVNKLCSLFGFQECAWWNRAFADFGDAVNPLQFKRHTLISINPIDYLTMSFGHNWSSCQTIDRTNIRDVSNTYDGMHCSGVLSYLLDGVTVVMYIVDQRYNGTDFEMQDKEKRCLFGIGENKIIQYRVYPDDRDGSDEPQVGAQMRQIMQSLIAECLDVPNLWKTKKGSSACAEVTRSYGTHYRDYTCYDNGVISFYNDGEEKNMNPIDIGHDPICPCCGYAHSEDGSLCCEDCEEGTEECAHCGHRFDPDDDDAIWAEDGTHFCCPDCAYDHGYEYVRDCGWYHVESNSDIAYDNYHEEYFFIDSDSVLTADDTWYIDEYSAKRDGYVYCENVDEWHKSDDYNVYVSSYTDDYFYDNGDAVFTSDGSVYIDEDEAHDAGYYYCEESDEWLNKTDMEVRYEAYDLIDNKWVVKEEAVAV